MNKLIEEMNLKELTNTLKLKGFSKQAQAKRLGLKPNSFYHLMSTADDEKLEGVKEQLMKLYAVELGLEVIEQDDYEQIKREKEELKAENERLVRLILTKFENDTSDEARIRKVVQQELETVMPILVRLEKHSGLGNKQEANYDPDKVIAAIAA